MHLSIITEISSKLSDCWSVIIAKRRKLFKNRALSTNRAKFNLRTRLSYKPRKIINMKSWTQEIIFDCMPAINYMISDYPISQYFHLYFCVIICFQPIYYRGNELRNAVLDTECISFAAS